MGLVFFFGFILFLAILIFILITGSIEYKIEKLIINKKEKLKIEFVSYLEFYLFSKIRIFCFKIDQDKLRKISLKDKLKKVDLNKIKIDKPFRKENIETIKKIQIELKKFKLELEIGTKNVLISSSLVTVFSIVLSFVLTKVISKFNEQDYFFSIRPIYTGENRINIKMNGIVKVKMVHIIYIIYIYLKEKGEWKKNERTSNRRTYDYRYE